MNLQRILSFINKNFFALKHNFISKKKYNFIKKSFSTDNGLDIPSLEEFIANLELRERLAGGYTGHISNIALKNLRSSYIYKIRKEKELGGKSFFEKKEKERTISWEKEKVAKKRGEFLNKKHNQFIKKKGQTSFLKMKPFSNITQPVQWYPTLNEGIFIGDKNRSKSFIKDKDDLSKLKLQSNQIWDYPENFILIKEEIDHIQRQKSDRKKFGKPQAWRKRIIDYQWDQIQKKKIKKPKDYIANQDGNLIPFAWTSKKAQFYPHKDSLRLNFVGGIRLPAATDYMNAYKGVRDDESQNKFERFLDNFEIPKKRENTTLYSIYKEFDKKKEDIYLFKKGSRYKPIIEKIINFKARYGRVIAQKIERSAYLQGINSKGKDFKKPFPADFVDLETLFVNNIMRHGKKSIAIKIFRKVIDILTKKKIRITGKPIGILGTRHFLEKAVKNATPLFIIKSLRRGSKVTHVPTYIEPRKARALAVKWLVKAARITSKRGLINSLYLELSDAYHIKGKTVEIKRDLHRLGISSRARGFKGVRGSFKIFHKKYVVNNKKNILKL